MIKYIFFSGVCARKVQACNGHTFKKTSNYNTGTYIMGCISINPSKCGNVPFKFEYRYSSLTLIQVTACFSFGFQLNQSV